MRLLLLACLAVVAAMAGALAHGEAEWIARGQYRNAAGEPCCGIHDCVALDPGDVSITARGDYYIRPLTEIVPRTEAQTSRDGLYWRCHKPDGSRRCFFAPPDPA